MITRWVDVVGWQERAEALRLCDDLPEPSGELRGSSDGYEVEAE